MSSKMETELLRATLLTFEDLGFMCPEPETEEEQETSAFEAAASVAFTGPFCGNLWVTTYGSILPTLAANMMGEHVVPSKRQQCDALGEITNVICGNLLPSIAGREVVFRLDAPSILVDQAQFAMLAEKQMATRISVTLDEGRADIRLIVDGCLPN